MKLSLQSQSPRNRLTLSTKLCPQSESPRDRLTLSTKLCLQSQSPRDRLTLSSKLCMQLVAALCQRYDKTRVTMSTASLLDCDDLIRAARIGSLLLRSEHPSWRYVGTIPDGSHRPAHAPCATHWANYTSSKKEPPDMNTLRAFLEHYWDPAIQSSRRLRSLLFNLNLNTRLSRNISLDSQSTSSKSSIDEMTPLFGPLMSY